jgi:hypothetical protein
MAKRGTRFGGSRESGSSLEDRSTVAVVREEGIGGDGVIRWSGRPGLGPWSSMGQRRCSGWHRRWWTVTGGAWSMVWCPHSRVGRCRLLFGDWSRVRRLGDGSVAHEG